MSMLILMVMHALTFIIAIAYVRQYICSSLKRQASTIQQLLRDVVMIVMSHLLYAF